MINEMFEAKCKKCGCFHQEVGDSKCKHINLCKNNFTAGTTAVLNELEVWAREKDYFGKNITTDDLLAKIKEIKGGVE